MAFLGSLDHCASSQYPASIFCSGSRSGFWAYSHRHDFLFHLSGFVAAASVKDKQWDFPSTLNYYVGRLIRIWPPHVLALFTLLFLWFIQKRTFFIGIFSANFLLLQSWFPTPNYYHSYNAVSWYLSTLMGLYLMMPLFTRYFKFCFGLSLVLPFLLSLIVPKNHNIFFFYICPFSNMFKFLCGMICYKLVSYIYESRSHSQEKISGKQFCLWSCLEISMIALVLFVQGCCATPLAKFYIRYLNPGEATWFINNYLVPLLFIFLIVFALEKGIVSLFLSTPIALFLGKISFILFLWHTNIRDITIYYDLFRHVPMSYRLILYVAICILVAFSLEYCLNSPVTRRLSSFHKNHPLQLTNFRQYVPLALAIGAVLLYLGCIIPRQVDHTPLIFNTMTSTCDKSLPVQVKIYPRNLLYIHPGKKPTSVIFQLNRCIDNFSCTLQMQNKKADVIVKFYLDKKLVKTIHAIGKDKIHKISFSCSNARQLRIEVDKNGSIIGDGTVLKSVSFTGYPN